MDARLTDEQAQLRGAAARLASDLGPDSVQDLADDTRLVRLEKVVEATGWRSLRSDGASGVEVALVAEEFGRGLVDVPFIGPVLADELGRHLDGEYGPATLAVGAHAIDARGFRNALILSGTSVLVTTVGALGSDPDLTRATAELIGPPIVVGDLTPQDCARWRSLAVVATTADLLGAARGAHEAATEYAKIREQYGKPIGSYQAVAHLLAEGLALIEGSVSVLRHAAWAVDELGTAESFQAAAIAKVYCARAARTVCENAIQVHGGIGNTWECLAHVYLRRVLTSTRLFKVCLEEIHCGLS